MSGIQTVLEPEWVPVHCGIQVCLLDIPKKVDYNFSKIFPSVQFLDRTNQDLRNWENIIHLDVSLPSLESKQSSRKNEGVRKFNTPLQ